MTPTHAGLVAPLPVLAQTPPPMSPTHTAPSPAVMGRELVSPSQNSASTFPRPPLAAMALSGRIPMNEDLRTARAPRTVAQIIQAAIVETPMNRPIISDKNIDPVLRQLPLTITADPKLPLHSALESAPPHFPQSWPVPNPLQEAQRLPASQGPERGHGRGQGHGSGQGRERGRGSGGHGSAGGESTNVEHGDVIIPEAPVEQERPRPRLCPRPCVKQVPIPPTAVPQLPEPSLESNLPKHSWLLPQQEDGFYVPQASIMAAQSAAALAAAQGIATLTDSAPGLGAKQRKSKSNASTSNALKCKKKD